MRSIPFVVAAMLMACGIPKFSKTVTFTDTRSSSDVYVRIRAGGEKLGCTPKQLSDTSSTFHCNGNAVIFRESRTDKGVLTGYVSVYCQNMSEAQCTSLAKEIMTAGGVVPS